MPTIKEQLDHINQTIDANKKLSTKLTNLANKQATIITKALENNLETAEIIDGYLISIEPEAKSPNQYPRYNIIIKKLIETIPNRCHFSSSFVITDNGIKCAINYNDQRLSHGQIEELIIKAFGF